MTTRRLLTLLPAVLLSAAVLAAPPHPGWSEGQPGANLAAVITALDPKPRIEVPKRLRNKVNGLTAVFYFSPTCPHCRHVAAEVEQLSRRLSGKAELLGVASGSSTKDDLAEFRATYGVTFPIIVDTEREIASAMGARSTPSMLLVAPATKTEVDVHDAWYPYVPSFDALVEARVTGNVWGVFRPGEYLGANFCGTCHAVEFQSMTLTHHAIAWRTLTERNEHRNAECTGCHVTGNGQPTGWNGDPHGALVNVQCEACHGPGGSHGGHGVEPSTTCEACHDDKHSIAFSYEKGLPLLDHYRAADMDDAAFREAAMALVNGEVPRALLAFADGANVGAAACASCHPTEHAAWSASPHAAAMGVLQTDDKHSDPACVRCHATATAAGPPPTALDGFRIDEGVSCESCHGPGEAHVAAGGGTDNIEGLGEDCPVCVIEAVCTGCHTQKWDPTWDLDTHLGKMRAQHGHAPASD